jgi:hypothetical protein
MVGCRRPRLRSAFVTVADCCALLAFEAAMDGDVARWQAYGSLADALDRPGQIPVTIVCTSGAAVSVRLEGLSSARYYDPAATDDSIN